MGYLEGFGVIAKKWVGVNSDSGRRVTLEYPEEVRPKPERFHGRHVLNRYEDGMEKCIGCELCAGVCPAQCIYVRGQDNDPAEPTSPGERFGFIYEINYLRCIHCDLCVEACPTEAITETKLFEFAFTNRSDAIYTKAELVVDDEGRPQQLPWENWDGGFDPAEDTSGWMRATAPSGDADFIGLVAWAGELGYGVRAPEGGVVPIDPVPEAFIERPVELDDGEADPDAVAGRGVFDAPHAAATRAAAGRVDARSGATFDDDSALDDAERDGRADVAEADDGQVSPDSDEPWSPTSDRGAFDAPEDFDAGSVDELIPMDPEAEVVEADEPAPDEPAEPWSPTSDRGAFDAPEGLEAPASIVSDAEADVDASEHDLDAEVPEEEPWAPTRDRGRFDLGDVDVTARRTSAPEPEPQPEPEPVVEPDPEPEPELPAAPVSQRGVFDLGEVDEPEPDEKSSKGRGLRFWRRGSADDEGGAR